MDPLHESQRIHLTLILNTILEIRRSICPFYTDKALY